LTDMPELVPPGTILVRRPLGVVLVGDILRAPQAQVKLKSSVMNSTGGDESDAHLGGS